MVQNVSANAMTDLLQTMQAAQADMAMKMVRLSTIAKVTGMGSEAGAPTAADVLGVGQILDIKV